MSDDLTPPDALLKQADFVRALARSLLGDVHLADDVAQETWIAAIERAPSRVENARAWLAAVTRNFAARVRRGDERRARRERDVARPEAIDSSDIDGSVDGASREEVLRSVTDAVLALEEPYRSTILLRYFEGLDASAIAQRERVPVATVRSRLQRALGKLRERLDRAHDGRRTWSIVLAKSIRRSASASPPHSRSSPHALSKFSASPLGTGVLIMSLKSKLAVLVCAALAGVAVWSTARKPAEGSSDVAGAPGSVQAPASGDRSHATSIDEFAAVDAPRSLDGSRRSASVAAEPFGALLVHVVYQSNGQPASGSHIKLLPVGRPNPFTSRVLGVTDASGDCRFERLRAGTITLTEHHGARGTAEIVVGQEAHVALTIPHGIDVRGHVVDEHDVPVANAEIWLSDHASFKEWTRIESARGDGSFELEEIGSPYYVGARDARHAPSSLRRVDGKPGDVCEVRLVIGGECARVEGRIVDDKGAGVAGARVRLDDGQHGRGTSERPGEWRGSAIPEFVTETSGRFAFDGVATPGFRVFVRADGFGSSETWAELTAGTTKQIDIALQPGTTVHGFVTTAAGSPVGSASISVGAFGDFLSTNAGTDASGAFRLESLAPGNISISAKAWKVGDARRPSRSSFRIRDWSTGNK